jgi:hypothetical protein
MSDDQRREIICESLDAMRDSFDERWTADIEQLVIDRMLKLMDFNPAYETIVATDWVAAVLYLQFIEGTTGIDVSRGETVLPADEVDEINYLFFESAPDGFSYDQLLKDLKEAHLSKAN